MVSTKNKNNENIVSDIKKLVDESIGLTTQWETNNVKWHKMRMRIKKTKTIPFIGCANIRMPTIETKIRKLKAALVNVIFGVRPIVQVIPTPTGNFNSALKIEKFIDHLIMDIIKLKNRCIVTIDQMLEKGFYLMKPFMRTDITTRIEELDVNELPIEEAMMLFDNATPDEAIFQEVVRRFDVDMHDLVAQDNSNSINAMIEQFRNGEEKLSFSVQDVIYNFPDVALCEPERVYVPTDAGFDPQSCDWIIHEFYLPLETIKTNKSVLGWDIGDIEDLQNAKSTDTSTSSDGKDKQIDTTKELREGISLLERTGKIKIWEFYGLKDIDKDGRKEKCVITIAPDYNKLFRKISLPFYSGKFPFVKFFYEITDDRWFSHRGMPEIIEDIVKEIDMQHNQKLDQQTIRNVPMYVYRAGMINKNTVQFVFGQGIPAQGMQPLADVIAPLNNNNPNVEFSYKDEQMLLESKIEELIGQVDFTLQSMINKRQPRTLGEVQLQNQNMQQIFSLDADMLRGSFEELFNWIWELWCQYGEDSYEFSYFGKDGWEKIKLTKEEIQGKYKITVRGNDQNTNPQTRIQKAQMIMMAMQNQFAVQTGVIQPMNIANGFKRFYQELDIPQWEELVSFPQPQPPVPQVRLKMDDLTDAEAAQVLQKQGIQPDVQGRQLKSHAMIQEKSSEQAINKVDALTKIASTIKELEQNDAEEEETSSDT